MGPDLIFYQVPSIIKIFLRKFKLQSRQEILRRRRLWCRRQWDPSQKQYAPHPVWKCVCVCGGGGGGGGINSISEFRWLSWMRAPNWWSGGCWFDPRRVGNILSCRFDHQISRTDFLFRRKLLQFLVYQHAHMTISYGHNIYMADNK